MTEKEKNNLKPHKTKTEGKVSDYRPSSGFIRRIDEMIRNATLLHRQPENRKGFDEYARYPRKRYIRDLIFSALSVSVFPFMLVILWYVGFRDSLGLGIVWVGSAVVLFISGFLGFYGARDEWKSEQQLFDIFNIRPDETAGEAIARHAKEREQQRGEHVAKSSEITI
jgi:hypothetical protein